jgi:hypothetical protein
MKELTVLGGSFAENVDARVRLERKSENMPDYRETITTIVLCVDQLGRNGTSEL